jgi:N-acetylmuramic acid 6-phosphate etherase
MDITGVDYDEASRVLALTKGHVKTAIVMILANVDISTAQERLVKADGFVRTAIER